MSALIIKREIMNGGTIELHKEQGLFWVKSVVGEVTKYSDAVSEFKANFFIFDAVNYGCLNF